MFNYLVRGSAVALDAVPRLLYDTEGFIVYNVLYLSVRVT